MIAHAFLTAMFLLSGQWIALLLNAPLVAFNVNKCVPSARPALTSAGGRGLASYTASYKATLTTPPPSPLPRIVNKQQSFDATEIFRTVRPPPPSLSSRPRPRARPRNR